MPPPVAAALGFHRGLRGYEPTPLRPLEALAAELGLGAVLLKDESTRLGLPAFKILGASWALERARQERPDTSLVIAASSGNHGRAVARAAADRSLACRVYVPASASEERAALIAHEGAKVERVDGDYDEAVERAASAARGEGAALLADTSHGGDEPSAEWVIEGYATLLAEVSAQAERRPDVVLVPAGVGSLAAAVVRWACTEHTRADVVAVEPATAACVTGSLAVGRPVVVPTPGTTMAGLDCATVSTVAWPTLRDGLAGAVTVHDAETHDAMRDLATLGLTIGDCGAATIAALRALATETECAVLRSAVALGADSTVVCIATEGASDPEAYRAQVGEA